MKLNWKKFFKSLTITEWLELLIILFIFVVGLITIFKFLFIGEEKTYVTPAGNYTCSGGLIKTCSGSKEVADYLGI